MFFTLDDVMQTTQWNKQFCKSNYTTFIWVYIIWVYIYMGFTILSLFLFLYFVNNLYVSACNLFCFVLVH